MWLKQWPSPSPSQGRALIELPSQGKWSELYQGLSQYFSGTVAMTWHQLVADDYHLKTCGAEYRSALMVFLFSAQWVEFPSHGQKTARRRTCIVGRFRNRFSSHRGEQSGL